MVLLKCLESVVCLDEERSSKVNYTTGESVGGSWTDKISNTKDNKGSGAHLTTDSHAVDDDEWVTINNSFYFESLLAK